MERLLSSLTAVEGLQYEHLDDVNGAQPGTIKAWLSWALQDQGARYIHDLKQIL